MVANVPICIWKAIIQETGIQFQLSDFVRLTPSKEGTVSKVPAWGMVCLS